MTTASKSRHHALMSALDTPVASPAPTPAVNRASPDSAVPALGTTGQLLRDEIKSVRERNAVLEAQAASRDDAEAVQEIDPKLVRHGPYRDRHDLSLADKSFAELKASIEHEGSNYQPAMLRPVAKDEAGTEFEVVYGHRRHKACLELGRPLRTIVRELSDREAVLLMASENSHRKGLSQFELAKKYKALL
ncbi:MAG: ParB/RepB/Spo0J family partition protein, partial [Gammaproteobacteria bacterium]